MGRPKTYADSSERVKAFRARFIRLDIRLDPDTAETLDKIAAAIDQPKTVLVESMIKFALTNHDWARFGLTHPRKK